MRLIAIRGLLLHRMCDTVAQRGTRLTTSINIERYYKSDNDYNEFEMYSFGSLVAIPFGCSQ